MTVKLTCSLAPRKHSFGTIGSGEMSSEIMVVDMAVAEGVNLNICRELCGSVLVTRFSGAGRSMVFLFTSYSQKF